MRDTEIIKEQQLHPDITSLDDVPSAARLAARQQFLTKWYKAVGMAPFVVLLFITLGIFGDNDSDSFWGRTLTDLTFSSLLWTLFITGYTFYLQFFLRCPRCRWRYGMGEQCNTCGLPRHPGSGVKSDDRMFMVHKW